MKNLPAFPQPEYVEFSKSESQEGMTLRDYFAAKALQGFASQYPLDMPDAQTAVATRCYAVADAMLKQRER